jgi:lantibiotic modifying enzyme
MPWQPLLQGDLHDRARDSVQAILKDLPHFGADAADGFSLAGGGAGQAVLHGYLAQDQRRSNHAGIANHLLRGATAHVANCPESASLYSGLAGVGWAISHLQALLPDADGEADAAEIDASLQEHLERSPWPEDYDLINGLVGYGVYALERLPRPAARACLERVVDHLAATAERRDEGSTWWTNPTWLPAEARAKTPRGYYNLGLAHGVPGVVALLGWACRAGVAVPRARPLLDEAVRWLLKQQGTDGFGYSVVPGCSEDKSRLAWCYGDPGVAAALLVAARCAAESAWEHEALRIAGRASRRPHEHSGVVDAGLCHGAAGLGHLFNRIYQATGEPRLGDTARSWFERTLAMRQSGSGIGGYSAWQPGGGQTWVADAGLLTGATGIALALLAATTSIEPAWDRVLLVAIPTAFR